MSSKSSILKSQTSDSSSKKRVSWGKKSVMEYLNDKNSNSPNTSETESPQFTPSLTPVHGLPSVSLQPILEDLTRNPSYLSPVIEVEENKNMYSSANSYEINITPFGIHETSPLRLRDIDWEITAFKRNLKFTPKKDFEYENSLNALKELLVRYEADLKIADLQHDYLLNKKEEIKEHYREINANIEEILKGSNSDYDKNIRNYNKIVRESYNFHKKNIFDVGTEEKWTSHVYSVNDNYCKVFTHKSTVIDSPILSCLIVNFTPNSLIIELKTAFEGERAKMMWEKFKAFLESTCRGTEAHILNYVSNKWWYFVKFIESYEKLVSISNIDQEEITEKGIFLTGSIFYVTWNLNIEFSNLESNWDIYTLICNMMVN